MDSLNGSLPRCAHSVFTTDTPGGTDNSSCSLCAPISVGEKEVVRTLLVKIDGKWENVTKK
jgi:hypothetical protein